MLSSTVRLIGWGSPVRALAAAVMLVSHMSAQVAPPRAPETDDLVDRTVNYVAQYQRTFLTLLADELYEQTRTPDGTRPGAGEVRLLRGELFLTYLAAEQRWMAIHDFVEVDGQPVLDREDLRMLLRQNAVRAIGSRLADRNARYNLGRVVRNFNEPTLALQVFSPNRMAGFRFSTANVVTDGSGVTVVTLTFRERDRPTLVSSVGGGPVFSTGEADVEAETGLVRRLLIRFEDGPVAATLETSFAEDPTLKLWVPVRFTEHYRVEGESQRETIRGEARYSNYRRFETSGRLAVD